MLEALQQFLAPPLFADAAESRTKLVWLVRLRWIALTAQLASVFPAIEFDILEASRLPAFLGTIGALAAVNVATWLGLRQGRGARPIHVFGQLTLDIAALSTLLALTGGGWNPLVPLLFVHTVLGALLLEGRASPLFFGLLILCLFLLQTLAWIPPGLEPNLLPARILFPAQLLVALVFWILTTWLSHTLRAAQAHVASLRERRTRIDRLRAVGALAAGLSHEFATPLNTAKLRIDRLARKRNLGDDPDLVSSREALDRCAEVLRRMSGAQLQPDRLELEPADVAELVENVCDTFAKVHEEATLEISIDRSGPQRAVLPVVAFSQALLNLIDNALQAGGPGKTVKIRVQSRGGRIEVSVLDRGAGWPEVVRSHLGEPFVTTKPEGVGLGLYYVHSLSEALGAELVLEDRPEGGAIARVSLPVAIPVSEARA
ncbi:MAG: HAMP domain-containing sensor histidine kinase [Myxococcota bacterium]|jgi:two-component system sensor histidine kinase RegB